MDLDTKSLLDALESAGIKATADYGDGLTYSDEADAQCVEIWRREILLKVDNLPHFIDDAMCGVMEDRDAVKEISMNLAVSFQDIKNMQECKLDGPSYWAVFGNGMTSQLATVGRLVLLGVHKAITEYLEYNKEEWLVDIANYVRDMEDDSYGDYLYELARDRELDERADA
jgi:hypothetical protein